MKLIIQIPCFNEEETLPKTIHDLPKSIEGIDAIETLVIDDGSTDNTSDVARKLGVHHLIRFTSNQGLATAFTAGLDAALKLGADIIVNTDADNQYSGEDIAALVKPILCNEADIVVGTRDINRIPHFSFMKKLLQKFGSMVIRRLSRTDVPDTTSGFRAYNREAAMRLNIFSDFSYTLETLIQAGTSGLTVAHVRVRTNPMLRESRLFSSNGEYVRRSLVTILRIYAMYNPIRVFTAISMLFFGVGLALVVRFLYFFFTMADAPTGHTQSLIAAAVLIIVGFQVFLFGLLADITAKNRKMMEETLLRVKKMEMKQ